MLHVHVRQGQPFLPVALGTVLCISATCGVKICNKSAKSTPVSFVSKTNTLKSKTKNLKVEDCTVLSIALYWKTLLLTEDVFGF